LAAGTAGATILPSPTITASADPFNASYVAANVFDTNRATEFATSTNGVGPLFTTDPNVGTWIEMDFGSTVFLDRFFAITRFNTADVIGRSRLTISGDPVFDASDPFVILDPTGSGGDGFVHSFPEQSGRYVRWEAVTSIGTSQNLGAQEMGFLVTPNHHFALPATVINGSPPYNGNYALANAANGDVGRDGSGREYASRGAGTNMFIDFDLGVVSPVAGFDLFQREASGDRFTAFDLLFSNDPTFATMVGTLSYSNVGFGTSDTFPSIAARYIRLDPTAGSSGNTGVADITFYGVPEPATAALLLLGVLGVRRRRRR
jgi:hypothetical protein